MTPTLLFASISHALAQKLAAELKRRDITIQADEALALVAIQQNPMIRVSKLAIMTGQQQPTTSKLVSRLVSDGSVLYGTDASDRRVAPLTLTKLGAQRAATAREAIEAVEASMPASTLRIDDNGELARWAQPVGKRQSKALAA